MNRGAKIIAAGCFMIFQNTLTAMSLPNGFDGPVSKRSDCSPNVGQTVSWRDDGTPGGHCYVEPSFKASIFVIKDGLKFQDLMAESLPGLLNSLPSEARVKFDEFKPSSKGLSGQIENLSQEKVQEINSALGKSDLKTPEK